MKRKASLVLLAGLSLVACTSTRTMPPAVPVPVHTPPPGLPAPLEAGFEGWVTQFKADALKAGIDGRLYDEAMGGLTLEPRIRELNEKQPEFTKPIWSYLDTAVSPKRIADGTAMIAANAQMLADIEARYGVPKEILVAIWGNESDYGRFMGSFNLFSALATLAYDGPRTGYARPQLIDALKIAQEDRIAPADMKSSWAGAMGQTQFVPSTWRLRAVDFDGDGRKDLWNSSADALTSAANLLVAEGWVRGERCAYEVQLPKDFPYEQADVDSVKTMEEWRGLGVTAADGKEMPREEMQGAIILPAGARGPAFMTFRNFKAVLKYNNATSYALAVCTLADRLGGGSPTVTPWPREEQSLSRNDRFDLQRNLQRLGYDPGAIDGVLGRRVRAALRQYQKARGIPADGFATKSLLNQMNAETAS